MSNNNGNDIGRPQDPNAFYKRVGRAIKEKETFDWSEEGGGWPSIKWVIANYMLRDYSEWERHRLIDSYVGQMDLYKSIDWLESQGMAIYRHRVRGGKGRNLEFITTNAQYKQAKIKEYERLWKQWDDVTDKVKYSLRKRLPGSKTVKFLTDAQEKLAERL